MLNKAIIIGNLGNDPDKRFTKKGTAVTSFSVATSEKWKDQMSRETKEHTEWHRVVAFRRLAEICGEYLHKGSKVYIEGKLRTRSWEKDGVKRKTTEIEAYEMKMLDSSRREVNENTLDDVKIISLKKENGFDSVPF